MKNVLRILLLVCILQVGCQHNADVSMDENDITMEEPGVIFEVSTKDAPTYVTIAILGAEASMKDRLYPRVDLTNAALEEYGYNVRINLADYDLANRLSQSYDASYDLFIDFIYSDNAMQQLITRGKVAPMDMIRNFQGLYERVPQRAWNELIVDEHIWCYPLVNLDEQLPSGSFFLTYDTQLVHELGEEPHFVDDLTELAIVARIAGKNHTIAVTQTMPPYLLHVTYKEWPFYVGEASRFILFGDGRVTPYIGSEIYAQDCAILANWRIMELEARYNSEFDRTSREDASIAKMHLQRGIDPARHQSMTSLQPAAPLFRTRPIATHGFS